jgi:hypothetical protein
MIPIDAVAQRDRISIDIGDMKGEIVDCRSDPAWGELSLSGKIRALIRERLDEIKTQQAKGGSND